MYIMRFSFFEHNISWFVANVLHYNIKKGYVNVLMCNVISTFRPPADDATSLHCPGQASSHNFFTTYHHLHNLVILCMKIYK